MLNPNISQYRFHQKIPVFLRKYSCINNMINHIKLCILRYSYLKNNKRNWCSEVCEHCTLLQRLRNSQMMSIERSGSAHATSKGVVHSNPGNVEQILFGSKDLVINGRRHPINDAFTGTFGLREWQDYIITTIAITSPHKLRRWIVKRSRRLKSINQCRLFTLNLKVAIGKQRFCL